MSSGRSPVERSTIARQREVILALEARLKRMVRLRGGFARAHELLVQGDVAGARRLLAEVLASWPSM